MEQIDDAGFLEGNACGFDTVNDYARLVVLARRPTRRPN
jgi:hypothetical protein